MRKASAATKRDLVRLLQWRPLVRTAKQVYRWDAAQRLGSFAKDGCIGAGPCNQADFKPDFRKRVFGAQRPEGISGGKGYLELAAACFQTAKEFGGIGRDRITGAFHHYGVGWQREAEIEHIPEETLDPSATRRER